LVRGKTTPDPIKLTWRYATLADVDFLADWNRQLIVDDYHRNSMTMVELQDRLRGWLTTGEYKAVIFSDSEPVAHAVFRTDKDLIYLRQFFVRRDRRRKGIGRSAFGILRQEIWPRSTRLVVEALCRSDGTVPFWRAVGYKDYCLTLEILPT